MVVKALQIVPNKAKYMTSCLYHAVSCEGVRRERDHRTSFRLPEAPQKRVGTLTISSKEVVDINICLGNSRSG